MDSPVKIQVARELARQAPPYTQTVWEEPWEGGIPSIPAGLAFAALDRLFLEGPKLGLFLPADFLPHDYPLLLYGRDFLGELIILVNTFCSKNHIVVQ